MNAEVLEMKKVQVLEVDLLQVLVLVAVHLIQRLVQMMVTKDLLQTVMEMLMQIPIQIAVLYPIIGVKLLLIMVLIAQIFYLNLNLKLVKKNSLRDRKMLQSLEVLFLENHLLQVIHKMKEKYMNWILLVKKLILCRTIQ